MVDKLHAMDNTPQKKIVTHRFEPTSKYVLLFIVGMALSLVISIWGNLTQWREHQDWEEADLKYRTLKMVLPSDDPNIRYIEKHFNVRRDKNVIDNVRKRVVAYKDSVRHHYEMKQMSIPLSFMKTLATFMEANDALNAKIQRVSCSSSSARSSLLSDGHVASYICCWQLDEQSLESFC